MAEIVRSLPFLGPIFELLVAFIDSSRLRLAFERSWASHPFIAVLGFGRGLVLEFCRLGRLGLCKYVDLCSLEIDCAHAGLSFPAYTTKGQPPWRLPDTFLDLSTDHLPLHPLISMKLLTEVVKGVPSCAGSAISSVQQLLKTGGLDRRWQGVHVISDDDCAPISNAQIAVCLHLFYPEMWPVFRQRLLCIPESWDLIITVPAFACTNVLAQITNEFPTTRVLLCANRGRDVLPFLKLLALGILDQYELVCKLHTKRSPHMNQGAEWLDTALTSLLGGPQAIAKLLQAFRASPSLGLVGSSQLLIEPGSPRYQGCNQREVTSLAKRAHVEDKTGSRPFFAGTMFWCRPTALALLRNLRMTEQDFPLEMAQTDGTSAHAVERLIWPLVEHAGFSASSVSMNE